MFTLIWLQDFYRIYYTDARRSLCSLCYCHVSVHVHMCCSRLRVETATSLTSLSNEERRGAFPVSPILHWRANHNKQRLHHEWLNSHYKPLKVRLCEDEHCACTTFWGPWSCIRTEREIFCPQWLFSVHCALMLDLRNKMTYSMFNDAKIKF